MPRTDGGWAGEISLDLDMVSADFYDTQGRYLGSGKATYADNEFTDNGATH